MMNAAEKKNQTLLKRRKRAIILSVALILLLSVALVFVMDYVKTITYTDVDGTEY